ncbi:hypothetical protein CYLTODRAFT_423959 [Cylindrobasidium torrendii FP15055 ss-10]|uniref:G-patch domain-containing protein n=1 Tax=Cylindrobasidium torrendii FP15055 ss-10 TaxID=1314674 RepID=A0A0D7B8N8_9AGAR|nr:hypothetical protein CYLTODRAFT_423959 [Cylindrobasidium torrendii FP15055 ss-10]
MSSEKVSFTVRRPSPVSRVSSGTESEHSFKTPALPRHRLAHLADSAPGSPLSQSVTPSPPRDEDSDSDGYDDETQDELVDAFDKLNGAQRTNAKKKAKSGPLVIPALNNKDWREAARKRKAGSRYVPPSAAASTGADGSVGGLGTRDAINSGPVQEGLQIRQKISLADTKLVEAEEEMKMEVVEEETEDQKALRAILAGDSGGIDGPAVDIIVSEEDAYRQDVGELPESASLDDYDRIPVSQFGAAMLRGMGWKEGQAATRKIGKGRIEPYVPSARPALLGLGAKEQEVYDDGSKNKRPSRRDNKYIPVAKVAREGSDLRRDRSSSPRRDSARSSRRSSPDRGHGSSSRYKTDDDRRRRDGDSDRRRDDGHDRRKDSDRRHRDSRSDRDEYRERRRDRSRDRKHRD